MVPSLCEAVISGPKTGVPEDDFTYPNFAPAA
jgi:hypothetical protein